MKDKIVQPAITMANLVDQLFIRMHEQDVPLPDDALPPAELQRLLALGIGVEGFETWIRSEYALPAGYRGTTLAIALDLLTAAQHVVWFGGTEVPLPMREHHHYPLPHDIALPWMRLILETIGQLTVTDVIAVVSAETNRIDIQAILEDPIERLRLLASVASVEAGRSPSEPHVGSKPTPEMVKPRIKIVVKRDMADAFQARVDGTAMWDAGRTAYAAVGNLIITYPEVFGIEIEWPKR